MNISNPSTINLTAVEPSVTRSKSMETTDVDPESDSDASGLFEMFGRLLDSQLSDSQLPGSQLEGEPLESAVDTAPDSQITPEDIADSVIDNVISIAITPEVQTHHLSGQASLVTDPLTALADKVLQNGPNLTLMNPSLQKQSSGNDLPGGGNISSEDLFFLNEGISAQAKFNPDNNEILSLRPRQIESLFSAPVPQQGNNLNVQATPLPYALAASTTADHTTLTGTQTLASNTGFTIESAVGSDNWNQQLETKIRWMTKLNISSAELKLHPAELGTVEIKISMEDDQTKINFIATNSNTKEIIESSLPRLRDLLANSGLQLEQSDVSSRNKEQAKEDNNLIDQEASSNHLFDSDSLVESSIIKSQNYSTSLVDHYV